MTREEATEVPVFACCSAGIGRWYWVAWPGEAQARTFAPALASGYEASASKAEAKAAERLGPGMKRIPARWASRHRRGAGPATRPPRAGGEPGGETPRPRTRFGGRGGDGPRRGGTSRLTFLYGTTDRDPPGPHGQVAVTRHRVVKQTATKIHVECEPFDEDEWARRGAPGADVSETDPKPRTLAVDRATLRTDGRFRCRGRHRNRTVYATEEAAVSDAQAALTESHAWCACLGVRFPCSVESIKAAYRRLARTAHPDAGGDPAEFRTVERAYREALAYFADADDGPT